MSKSPLVSICCITYNHEKFIRDAIEGFLMQQTNFDFEIIVHDDASTDGTAEIIREYEKKYPELFVTIFQNENQYSQGIKPWPNFVFPMARGKYIALCEGDDYWTEPLKLQKQVDFLERNSKYVGVGCFYNIVEDFDGKVVFKDLTGNEEFRSFSFNDYLTKGTPGIRTLTMVYRSDSLKKVSEKILLDKTTKAAGDVLLVSYLLKHEGDICLLPFNGAVYRKHVNGLSAGLRIKKYLNRKQHFFNYEGVMTTVLTSKKERLFYWYKNLKLTFRSDIAQLRFKIVLKDFLLLFNKD